MAKSTPLFVGLDVHKDSIAVAHAQGVMSQTLAERTPGLAAGYHAARS